MAYKKRTEIGEKKTITKSTPSGTSKKVNPNAEWKQTMRVTTTDPKTGKRTTKAYPKVDWDVDKRKNNPGKPLGTRAKKRTK